MFTFESRVRYSETDENGLLSVGAIIDYMQDCTNFQSEDLNVGLQYLREHNYMWVLTSWHIIFDEFPAMGEKIVVGTSSYGCEKMFGYRNFLIKDGEGNQVAIADSLWVLMDCKKMRPVKVPVDMAKAYGKFEPLKMEYVSRKINCTVEGQEKESFQVKKYHLDTNHHVNNRQYVQMAMEYIDEGVKIKSLRVSYKKQAVLGDSIVPVVYTEEPGKVIVSLNNTEGRAYAVVEFVVI